MRAEDRAPPGSGVAPSATAGTTGHSPISQASHDTAGWLEALPAMSPEFSSPTEPDRALPPTAASHSSAFCTGDRGVAMLARPPAPRRCRARRGAWGCSPSQGKFLFPLTKLKFCLVQISPPEIQAAFWRATHGGRGPDPGRGGAGRVGAGIQTLEESWSWSSAPARFPALPGRPKELPPTPPFRRGKRRKKIHPRSGFQGGAPRPNLPKVSVENSQPQHQFTGRASFPPRSSAGTRRGTLRRRRRTPGRPPRWAGSSCRPCRASRPAPSRPG